MESRPAYYAIIPANVRYDKDLKANAKLLYGEITALCNERGYCWASNAYFADLYGVSERSIKDWIKGLADKEYITVQVLRNQNGTTRKIWISDGFRMAIPREPVAGGEEICTGAGRKLPKGQEENFTHNNTYNNTSSSTVDNNNFSDDKELAEIVKAYEENISLVTPFIFENLGNLKDDYGAEWVWHAIEYAVKKGRKACTLVYIEGVLRGWRNDGVSRPWEKDQAKTGAKEKDSGGVNVVYKNGVRVENGSPIILTKEDAEKWQEYLDQETERMLREAEGDYNGS